MRKVYATGDYATQHISGDELQQQFALRAHVLKPGRTLTVCDAHAFALDGNHVERLVATMTGTLIAVYDREGVEQ